MLPFCQTMWVNVYLLGLFSRQETDGGERRTGCKSLHRTSVAYLLFWQYCAVAKLKKIKQKETWAEVMAFVCRAIAKTQGTSL